MIIDNVMSTLRKNYGMDYDYDNYYACHNGSNCCDGNYCRCGRITNARVTQNVKVWELLGLHFDKCDQDELIDSYCVERILSLNDVWNKENWEVNIHGGYYGEEIHGCSLLDREYKSIQKNLNEYNKIYSNSEKIEYILNLEYGYILDELKDCTYSVIKTPKESIILGQQDYRKKLDQKIVSYYEEYPLPRGIVVRSGNNYRCIDGYHRISAGDGDINVLLAEKS